MAVTRSAAAFAEVRAARHPQADEAFKEGVASVFRQWTALELAVHNQWGGPLSQSKADGIVAEVLKLFERPSRVYKDVRFLNIAVLV